MYKLTINGDNAADKFDTKNGEEIVLTDTKARYTNAGTAYTLKNVNPSGDGFATLEADVTVLVYNTKTFLWDVKSISALKLSLEDGVTVTGFNLDDDDNNTYEVVMVK